MKKIFLQPLYISVVFILTTVLGFFSNVAQIFEYNINKDFFKPYAPLSYICLVMTYIIFYLILVIIWFIKNNQRSSPSESDLEILNSISNFFTLDTFYVFKDYLAQTRSVFINQVEGFENGAKRFLDTDMTISNKSVEKAKKDFLSSLLEFTRYTDEKFNPIGNGDIVKFLGGTSEYEIMRSTDYENEKKRYLEIVKKMNEEWFKFQETIKKKYPNFVWKK